MGMATHEGSASTDAHPENHERALAAARDLLRGEPTVGTGRQLSHDRGDGQDVGGVHALRFAVASFFLLLKRKKRWIVQPYKPRTFVQRNLYS
jgi:hypothetical protein